MKTNISDSEMKVMEKIWDCGEMISVADVVALLNEMEKAGHIRRLEHS